MLSLENLRKIPFVLYAIVWSRLQVARHPPANYMQFDSRNGIDPVDDEDVDWSLDGEKRLFLLIDRWIPGRSTCLTRALAFHRILKRRRIRSVVHLGVRNSPEDSELNAHAWLSVSGDIILGGEICSDYHEVARICYADGKVSAG